MAFKKLVWDILALEIVKMREFIEINKVLLLWDNMLPSNRHGMLWIFSSLGPIWIINNLFLINEDLTLFNSFYLF